MPKRFLYAAAVLLAIALALGLYLNREALRCDGKTDGARIGRVLVLVGC
jgi:hypothetical protein